MGSIEHVEELAAELQAGAFGEVEGAGETEVEIDAAGGAEDVAAGVAVDEVRGRGKSVEVEPAHRIALGGGEMPIGDAVRASGDAGVGGIEIQRDGIGEPGLSGPYTAQLPAAEDGAAGTVGRQEGPAFSEGEFPDTAGDEALSDVEVGIAAVELEVARIARYHPGRLRLA